MTLQEFQQNAKRTLATIGNEKLDLSHMVLGIHSEYNEVLDAHDDVNTAEELTDILWYLANYCTLRNINIETINQNIAFTNADRTLNYYTSKLQDIVKKYIAYNKPINQEEEIHLLICILYDIKQHMKAYNINLSKALQNNIDKLKIRYPEKFNTHQAINRNLNKERKELEK